MLGRYSLWRVSAVVHWNSAAHTDKTVAGFVWLAIKRSRLVYRDTRDRSIHRPKTLFSFISIKQSSSADRQTDKHKYLSAVCCLMRVCVCVHKHSDRQSNHPSICSYRVQGKRGYRYLYISTYIDGYRLILRWKLAGSHPQWLDIYMCVHCAAAGVASRDLYNI